MNLSEQERIRREKLSKLRELGIDPYPAALFPVSHRSQELLDGYSEEKQDKYKDVVIAGRLMSQRDMGKAAFAQIQDDQGKIQIYVNRDQIAPGEDKTAYNQVWKKLLDIGDIIGVRGEVFTTKTGETTLKAKKVTLLSKSLRPLPIVKEKEGEQFDQVTDPEFKYRQRYVDLIINPQVKETFRNITKMKAAIRHFLDERGALEVDTPVLQPIPGGASARPFVTHHNALDIPLYLRIANELYLKRLIVGGYDWVYEFSRNFRNEGMDKTHNPEFTILEFYTAYKDYFWMMDITEQLLETTVRAVSGDSKVKLDGTEIDFKAPYPRVPIFEAIEKETGYDMRGMDEVGIRTACHEMGIHVDKTMGKGKLIDEVFGEKCEAKFVQPTFIIDYPVELSPLTKKHRSEEGLVERFELIVNGKELANAYSELNDPIDQRARFEEQLELLERGDDEAMYIDQDFLRALEYGMPPTSGIGIGIERLAMLITENASIQDVLFFPQMRPENPTQDPSQENS